MARKTKQSIEKRHKKTPEKGHENHNGDSLRCAQTRWTGRMITKYRHDCLKEPRRCWWLP